MADFSCHPHIFLWILLILFFSSYSHLPNFSTHLSVVVPNLKTTGNEPLFSRFISSRKNSSTIVVKVKSKFDMVEEGLARARAAIHKATVTRNYSSHEEESLVSRGSIYINPEAFHQSYLEMERRLKVYVYTEGDSPTVHDGPCKSLYASEGRFIHEIEQSSSFRTRNAEEAHVFFLSFSVAWMVKYMYDPLGNYNLTLLRQFVDDYVKVVSTKYPFWNRTRGADHFMLACHDWGPEVSRGNSLLYNKSIRVLCNANTSEGFNPQKDVSLPEIYLYAGKVSPKLLSPTNYTSRPFLAFFAGGLHGPIRPILLHHWRDRDSDIRVYEYLPKGLDYYSYMLQSKFCLCPSGYEVASPRIVESIYAECVPVILSKNYVLPFSDVLRWEAFSVQVNVSEIPRLKEVLSSITKEEYKRLKEGVRAVRKHFELNRPAKRFDVFHMILHSIWLRRINMRLG